MVEILEHFHGSDAHFRWLMAFAEQANDTTREGWPGRDVLARRTGKSPSRCSAIATELEQLRVITRTGGGRRNGGPARYRLEPLPVTNSTAARGPCGKPNNGRSPAQTKRSAYTPANPGRQGSLWPNPVKPQGPECGSQGSESGSQGSQPSPLPAETGSLPLISPDNPQRAHAQVPRSRRSPPPEAQFFLDQIRRRRRALEKDRPA